MKACPITTDAGERITMAHGGGGAATHQLLEDVFYPAFSNPLLDVQHDGAMFEVPSKMLAFTSDAHVVTPLIFPGGDIGRMAVFGTANDVAMCGAEPQWLSINFVLEEGLPIGILRQIVGSIATAAREAGVVIACGDTKVVEHGKADGMYISCSAIGIRHHDSTIAPQSIRVGDSILISGDVGRHGMAVLSAREEIALEGLVSDLGLLWPPVRALLEESIPVHCLRDLTRGGLAAALVEMAKTSGMGMRIKENSVPVSAAVGSASEILGLDPMSLACEGRMVIVVDSMATDEALDILHRFDPVASLIGHVTRHADVVLENPYGTERPIILPMGELLPRIC